ncbi:MAG: pyridoxine 5'-phosphate synthase [Deltaproteobacteria bacterium]|nr:MAG: pyridoxine 5'-phosphate synthase [Deltaproteobacteria bacterium]
MPRLGVNVDHVATLREARRITYPDPVTAAALAELAGAECIVVHLREDRRHIKDRDLQILRETVQTSLNMEMAAPAEMVKIASQIRPNVSTLVPERREELTTEGGLDVLKNRERIGQVVKTLKGAGIKVSLFIDPVLEQIRASHEVGGDAIEIHTGLYCEAKTPHEVDEELKKVMIASREANGFGLEVKGGHGLNYFNVSRIADIPEIEELSIGHSIVARAVLVGMERAVREMIALIQRPPLV